MAVICTLLASGGFVAAGYVGTSTADAAARLSLAAATGTATSIAATSTSDELLLAGLDSYAEADLGVKMSFANTLIQAKKPAAKEVFDLTSPSANTPQLANNVSAMRGDIPEVSAELMSQVRRDILAAAYQGLGHPYVWGGTSFEHGWDCSGFVQWAYAQAGVRLPRTEQWMPMVQTNNPQPGDIVVQNPDGPNHWSHIGIYIGNGKMISALNPSVGTFIHAPADVSSSSSYFTMPAFASADEKAKADAKAKASAKATASGATTDPSATPTQSNAPTPTSGPTTSKPAPSQPATGQPATSKPATAKPTPSQSATGQPATNKPSTPVPSSPASSSPAPSSPVSSSPTTQTPATTEPAAKDPATKDPATVDPATSDPTSSGSATARQSTSTPDAATASVVAE